MWQRKQTLYMILAIAALGLQLVVPYAGVIPNPGEADISEMWDKQSVITPLFIQENPFSLALTGLAMVSTVVNIFLYRNRPLQLNVGRLNLVLIAAILVSMLAVLYDYAQGALLDQFQSVRMGLVLPVIALICTYLANRGIQRDEELVRSADRFR